MHRRRLLHLLASAPLLPFGEKTIAAERRLRVPVRRARPGDPSWPSPAQWRALDRQVDGRLLDVRSPFAECIPQPDGAACRALFERLKNPYYIRDEPALTQTLGWVDAWMSAPSVYAVAPSSTAHVVAAVNFARTHDLRLVIKGGGHSYQGTSNAPDSLLIWMRDMDHIEMHDAFVARGCAQRPVPAVTVEAAAIWMHVYDAVTTAGGRYVQGGGCATVGVAGLVQSGGFGSFSKHYGTAAAGLVEAEVVTADGAVRVANACENRDLFFALKGGGGGSFGVVTRLSLRTHELPASFGGVLMTVSARSDAAFRELIARFLGFYRERLFNPHWGETVAFEPDNRLRVGMVFQGLDEAQANEIWQRFVAWPRESPGRFAIDRSPVVLALPARHFWDPRFLRRNVPELVVADTRPGAAPDDVFWRGDLGQVGQYVHGYDSTWLPASLLAGDRQSSLADAIFAATRHWSVSLHFNKGLAGATDDVIADARDTATNPDVLDAFALAIVSAEEQPAYPGIRGHAPNVALGRDHARRVATAMAELRRVAPRAGSYVSESNYFADDWQRAFWGVHYARLRAIKAKYDPRGLFVAHHMVGSEGWSADGFTRQA